MQRKQADVFQPGASSPGVHSAECSTRTDRMNLEASGSGVSLRTFRETRWFKGSRDNMVALYREGANQNQVNSHAHQPVLKFVSLSEADMSQRRHRIPSVLGNRRFLFSL